MPSMIFIYTGKLSEDPKSGSAVRPVRMLEAFKEIGYEVSAITGYSSDRARLYSETRRRIRDGKRYDFCYIETTTMPMALGDPGHFPLRPFLDLWFLNFLRHRGISVLLFYRDVYWNFGSYNRQVGFAKRNIALCFYRFELLVLYKLLSLLYVPSERMANYLPNCPSGLYKALPPGCTKTILPKSKMKGSLKLLYVGGVTPPEYDTSDMLDCVRGNLWLDLLIISRKEESSAIMVEANKNIHIDHKTSKELQGVYESSDIVLIFNKPTEYLSFAMPVKLFEALGYGVPVLARSGTAAGDFVAREGVGWLASGPEEARALLLRLAEHPEKIEEMRAKVQEAAARHTWIERALQVARDAERIRASGTVLNALRTRAPARHR